jgi:hypothetical protein
MSLDQNTAPVESSAPATTESAPDYDALLKSIESPSPERAQSGPEPEAAQPPADPNQWKPAFDKFGFKVGGRDLSINLTSKEDYERAKTWIQQGYDYSSKMQQFKQQYGQFLDLPPNRLAQYSEIDSYAKQNPQWWNYIENQYASRDQKPAAGDQVADDPLNLLKSEFEKRFSGLEEMLQSKEQSQRIQQEDSALDNEIKSIRESYPQYNFDQIMSDDGKTLEFRVMEHAQQIGTNSFKAAFRDFYHDQLVKDAALKASEEAAAKRQEMAKKGILGTTQAPKKGIKPAQNIKNMSYDELAKQGLAELGIT